MAEIVTPNGCTDSVSDFRLCGLRASVCSVVQVSKSLNRRKQRGNGWIVAPELLGHRVKLYRPSYVKGH